ncbi:MAG: 50S ribosomal protein L5, partial [Gloeobacteraceae cyanobacterium ES-bin-144]|nr:50S ribosomal protein L5 [Verrucomicrobiales bacterium]
IEIDQIKRQIGFDLIFVTSATTDAEGRSLLGELGMPFRDMKKANEAEAAAV